MKYTRLAVAIAIACSCGAGHAAPAGSGGASPSPAPAPAPAVTSSSPDPEPEKPLTPEAELDLVMGHFAAKRLAEGFGEAERFVSADDRPDGAAQVTRRARMLLGKIEDIKKLLPPPPGAHDGELAQLLYASGQALEEGGDTSAALDVYKRIVREYPKAVWQGGPSKDPIAMQAQERLKWHSQKHPWVQKDADTLMAKIREALAQKKPKLLDGLIARVGFWSGPFQSEGSPDDPVRVLKYLDSVWPKNGPVTVASEIEAFSDRERQIFLRTSGWTGEYPEIYLILEKVAEGWHWSGAAFAEPKDAAVTGERLSPEDLDPSAAPSPQSSPSPRR